MGCTDMSEAGLLIKNDSDDLLINDTYNNLYLFRKLKLTDLPYQAIGNTGAKMYYTNLQDNEVIAPVAKTSGGELRVFSVHGASNGYLQNAGQWQFFVPANENIDDVYAYIFGVNTSTETQAHGYGMQVYDENGVCVYNSNNKPMRVLHYANNVGDTNKWDGELDGYVVPSNRVCAIHNCAVARVAMGAGQSRPVRMFNAYISASGEVLQQAAIFGVVPISFVLGDYIGYMVVDVTNY